MSKFIVIDIPKSEGDVFDVETFDSAEISNQFESLPEARAAIRASAERCMEDDNEKITDPENYCSRSIICEVVEVVRPIPVIKTSVRLKKIE